MRTASQALKGVFAVLVALTLAVASLAAVQLEVAPSSFLANEISTITFRYTGATVEANVPIKISGYASVVTPEQPTCTSTAGTFKVKAGYITGTVAIATDKVEIVCSNLVAGTAVAVARVFTATVGGVSTTASIQIRAAAPSVSAVYERASKTLTASLIPAHELYVAQGAAVTFALNSLGFTVDEASAQCFLSVPDVTPIATTPVFSQSASGLVVAAAVATDFSAVSGRSVSLKCTGIIAPASSSAHTFGVLSFGTSASFTRVAVAAVESNTAGSIAVTAVHQDFSFDAVMYRVVVSPAAAVDASVAITHSAPRDGFSCDTELTDGALQCYDNFEAAFVLPAAVLSFTVTDLAGVEHMLTAALPGSDLRAPEGTRVTADREARTVTFVAQRGPTNSISFFNVGLPASLLTAMQCSRGPQGSLIFSEVVNESDVKFDLTTTADGAAGPADWVTVHCVSARFPALGVAAHSRVIVFHDSNIPVQFSGVFSGFPDVVVKAALALDAPYPGVHSRLTLDLSTVVFPAQTDAFSVDVEVPGAARGVLAAATSVAGSCTIAGAECTAATLTVSPASGLWRVLIEPGAIDAGATSFAGVTAAFHDVALGPRASALTAPTTTVVRFTGIPMPAGTAALPLLRAPASQRQDFAMRRVGPVVAPATAPAALVAGETDDHVIDFFAPVGLPSGYVVTLYQTFPVEKRAEWDTVAVCVDGCSVISSTAETLTLAPASTHSIPANTTVSLTLSLRAPEWVSLGGYDYRFVVSDAAVETIYGTGVYNTGAVVPDNAVFTALISPTLRPGQVAPLVLSLALAAPHPTEAVDYSFSFSARREPYFTVAGGALTCSWALDSAASTVGFPVPVEISDSGRTFTVKYQASHLSNAIKLAVQADPFTELSRALLCSGVRHAITTTTDASAGAPEPADAAFSYSAAFGNGTVFSTGFVPFDALIEPANPTVALALTDAVSYSRGSFAAAAVPYADTETVPQGASVTVLLTDMQFTATSTCALNGVQLARGTATAATEIFTVPAPVAIGGSVQLACDEVLFGVYSDATSMAKFAISMPLADNVNDEPVFTFAASPAAPGWPLALTVATLAPGAGNTAVVSFLPLRYDLSSGDSFAIELAEFAYTVDADVLTADKVCRNSTNDVVASWSLSPSTFKVIFSTAVPRTRNVAAAFVCAGVVRPVDKRFQQFSASSFVLTKIPSASAAPTAPAAPVQIDNAGVLAAVDIAEFGQVSRALTPANATAGSGFGTLTVAVSPVPQEIPAGGFFRVELPLSWSVSDAVSCRASVRSANPNAAELSTRAVRSPFPSAAEYAKARGWGAVKAGADARWVEVVFAAAVAPTEDTLYVFCDSVKVSEKPSAVTIPAGGAVSDEAALHYTSLRVYDRRHRPLMQSGWAMIPPVLATVAPVRQVQQTFSVARSQPFTADDLDTVIEAIAESIGVDAAFVTIVRQTVLSTEAAAAHGAAEGAAAAPEAATTLRVTYQVSAAPAEIVEDVHRNVDSKAAALSSAIARGADTPVLQLSKLSINELDAGCFDGVQAGDETDVDCGGATCQPCGNGGACLLNADCVSNTCRDGRCANPNSAPRLAAAGVAAAAVAAAVFALVV